MNYLRCLLLTLRTQTTCLYSLGLLCILITLELAWSEFEVNASSGMSNSQSERDGEEAKSAKFNIYFGNGPRRNPIRGTTWRADDFGLG
ncbi:hypothetical protein F5B21DRAFT_396130 [Xylaria acuta]|nr:hypothetical protein F5B21DRAFT_396130 [Xylaria acuta]